MLESLNFETQVRLAVFIIILGLMMVWELAFPRRSGVERWRRWPGNFGIVLINTLMLVALPVSAVAASLVSIEHKFGLFFLVEVAFWPKIIVSLIVLDLLIYWQHRLFHMMAPLWRVHRMHHTDTAFDVSTALRFHPIEILLSILIKAGVIILLGAPPFAVILFEILLNGSAMFNHSNIRMPIWLDRILRFIIVTPDMHRVHHSVLPKEHNNNYGFALSVWDRIFNSYVSQPEEDHKSMRIGLRIFYQPEERRLDKLLTQPFRS